VFTTSQPDETRSLNPFGAILPSILPSAAGIECIPSHFSTPSFAYRLVKGGLDMKTNQIQKADYFRVAFIVRVEAQNGRRALFRLLGTTMGLLVLAMKILNYLKFGVF
jgi:hypothetical protein